jgi:Fe-S cluster assembly protein SufD
MVCLASGGRMVREDVQVNLRESGAECSVNGFYVLDQDGQHVDNHAQIDHMATHGTSDMVYKGILNKKSHGVFNGMVYVHPLAQKTKAHQANHNLLLSRDAAIETKPEFEIYADDVKCVHGDTVGQLDTEALFYLRSRGIDKMEAMRLLAQAFSAEVIDRVDVPVIAARMQRILKESGL